MLNQEQVIAAIKSMPPEWTGTVLGAVEGRAPGAIEAYRAKILAEKTGKANKSPFARGWRKASEFKDEIAPIVRIWFGLYPGALVLLIGETGAGKSSLLYNICIHAARNEALWGIDYGLHRPLKILYIDPENSGNYDSDDGGLSQQKVLRIGQGKPELLQFHDGQGVNLSLVEHWTAFEEFLELERPDIVVLDPIINLFGTKDENDNAEAGRQFSLLQLLAKRLNICIVAVHHTGRDGSGIFGRGATARLGNSDVGIVMRVKGNTEDVDDDFGKEDDGTPPVMEIVRCQIVKNRKEPAGKASLFLAKIGNDQFERRGFEDWKSAGSVWTPGSGAKPSKREAAEEEIYQTLLGGGWQPGDGLIAAVKREGIGERNIRAALAKLERDGTIEKGRMGNGNTLSYRLKPQGDNDTPPVPEPPSEPRKRRANTEEGDKAVGEFLDTPEVSEDTSGGWRRVE
jgi:energy-coupling factor transporter ATP-binding protein EcfA2